MQPFFSFLPTYVFFLYPKLEIPIFNLIKMTLYFPLPGYVKKKNKNI